MNDVKIKGSHPISENLSTITVGDQTTCLEISDKNGARVTGDLICNGDLEVTGDIKGNVKDVELDLTKIISTDLTIDDSGDITLDAGGGDVTILQADLTIPVDKKVIFGNTGEYIVGDNTNLTIVSSGHVEFDGCGVGFDLEIPTYNASDTDVNFINGNKQFVTFDGGDIADLNLIFPKVSGNFLLMLKQDGTGGRTVTNYKVWDRVDSQAGSGSATVKFAGGSNPDLTDDANHVDIISFFYDGDNEIAYGVATLDFQF